MKTKILPILAALLLLGGGFVACDDSAATRAEELPDGIKPVALEGEAGEELNVFFSEHSRWFSNSVFEESQKTYPLDTCVAINSMKEFHAIDFHKNSLELPAIDFTAYTLVIGQHWAHGGGFYVASQCITVESRQVILNLTIKRRDGIYPAVAIPRPVYYWGLYPKFLEKLVINTVYNYEN
jgi:hypothetical protein